MRRGDLYKCKCGLLNGSTIHESPSRGTWVTVKCLCGERGTSWDKERFMSRENYEIPGFVRQQEDVK